MSRSEERSKTLRVIKCHKLEQTNQFTVYTDKKKKKERQAVCLHWIIFVG